MWLVYLCFIAISACSATHNSSSLGDYLMSLKHEFDIVCLSETWLHENNKEINDFLNYSQVHKYRENKCGGGVSILLKKTLDHIGTSGYDKKGHIL